MSQEMFVYAVVGFLFVGVFIWGAVLSWQTSPTMLELGAWFRKLGRR